MRPKFHLRPFWRNLLVPALLLTTGLLSLAAMRHEYHVSVTQIDYNSKTQNLEIAVKIFTDDLEVALETLGTPKLRLGTDREYAKSDSIIGRYLNNRLRLQLNGFDVAPTYIGKEHDFEATWCYLEVTTTELPRKIEVRNRILLEQFDDQANLVHLKVESQKESMILRKGGTTEVAYFE